MSTHCSAVRETISARLDGEEATLTTDEVERHLRACDRCHRFTANLAAVNRRISVGGAETVPDLTAPILVALAEDRGAQVDGRTSQLRVLVALAGVVQLVLALPVLFGAAGATAHLGRDLGAFELALGAGLLLAAWQPRRAAGVLPVAAVVAVVATAAGLIDLAAGRATLLSELTHLTELVGVAALWALTRRLPDATVLQPAVVGPGGTTRGA